MTDAQHTPDPAMDHQYTIEPWVADPVGTRAALTRKSEAVADAFAAIDVAYGDDPRRKLDIARPANQPAPALIFIHGGYWQGSSKEDRRFPAPAFQGLGAAFVPIEYRLAPAVSIDRIIDDVRTAVAWLYGHGADYGIDPERLYAAGNSAGGHLTAMVLAEGWQAGYGVPADVVKGGCAVSGIFDLAPLLKTGQRGSLHLSDATVAAISPINHLPAPGTPLVVSWGGRESDEFKRQSHEYIAACRARGVEVEVVDRPDDDHFTIMGEFGEPSSNLFQAIARQMGVAR
jgi:arylformamidase